MWSKYKIKCKIKNCFLKSYYFGMKTLNILVEETIPSKGTNQFRVKPIDTILLLNIGGNLYW